MRVLIGHALLEHESALTAKELEARCQTHQSNIKKEADRMADSGLISRLPWQSSRGGGGRRPNAAYALTPGQRRRAAAELPPRAASSDSEIGRLERGQEIVSARVDSQHVQDLMHVLAESQSAAEASWVAVCGQDLLLVFEGADPAAPAIDLLALLDAARIPGYRSSVARVRPAAELISHARRSVAETRRVRIKRDTRRAS